MSVRATVHVAAIVLLAGSALLGLTAVPAAGQLADGVPRCGEQTSADPRPTPSLPVLRVATYNVLHTQDDLADRSLDVRLSAVADALAAAGADIVGLQEAVETANHGNYAERLAAELAARTGWTWSWCWFQSNPHWPGEPDTEPGGGGGPATTAMEQNSRSGEAFWSEGVGIVARFPVLAAGARRLSPRAYEAALCDPDDVTCRLEASFDSRQIHHNRLDTPWGAVDAFATHLAHTLTALSDTTRLQQIRDGLAYIAERSTADATPDIYVGDFNSLEGSAVHAEVTAAGSVDTFRVARPDDPGYTSGQAIDDPQPTVDERIDYVFVRAGSCPIEVEDSTVIGDAPVPFDGGVVWPSDHYGVVSTIALGGACAGPQAPDTGSAPSPEGTSEPSLPETGAAAWMVAVGMGLVVLAVGLRGPRATGRTRGRSRAAGPPVAR